MTNPKTTVHFYDGTATKITRTRSYATRARAWRAIRRAQRAGKIAVFAGVRAADDPPTDHH